jgi:hypothetical protein
MRTVQGDLTYDLATTEQHTVELDPKVHTLDKVAQGSPLLAFLNRIGRPRIVRQPIYMMLRKRQFPRFFNLAASYAAGDATITIAAADVEKLKLGYHILNTLTREILAVTGAPAATLPTADRGVGTVAAAASVGAADEMLILGYRSAELDSKFQDRIRQPEVIFNFVAELQDVYGVSQFESASAHIAGANPLSVLRMDKLEEMRLRLEDGVIWDQRAKYQRANDSKWVYKSGGVDSFTNENETNFGGALDEASLLAACTVLSRHGPRDRLVITSPQFMEKFNLVFVGDRRLNQNVPRSAGIAISTYECGALRLSFVSHPLLQDAASTDPNSLNGIAWVLDMADLSMVTMSGPQVGFFRWFQNVQTPGDRVKQDQLIVNYGVKMTLPEHFARWYNP